MATRLREEGASAPFDAARWFADWADNGGVAILTPDARLYVSRLATIDRRAAQRLDGLRVQIMRPEAATALAGLLRANAEGPKQ